MVSDNFSLKDFKNFLQLGSLYLSLTIQFWKMRSKCFSLFLRQGRFNVQVRCIVRHNFFINKINYLGTNFSCAVFGGKILEWREKLSLLCSALDDLLKRNVQIYRLWASSRTRTIQNVDLGTDLFYDD